MITNITPHTYTLGHFSISMLGILPKWQGKVERADAPTLADRVPQPHHRRLRAGCRCEENRKAETASSFAGAFRTAGESLVLGCVTDEDFLFVSAECEEVQNQQKVTDCHRRGHVGGPTEGLFATVQSGGFDHWMIALAVG